MNTTSQTIIDIQTVSKHFGSDVRAVDEVSLTIRAGEFFALLGPSGCGKTTLLRILAGFEAPSAGRVVIDGEDMQGVAANKRNVNMVFQSYAVFPHMSVFDNVAYGLKVSGVPAGDIATRVEEALELVKLSGLGARRPHQLSGGQRQRVALARALVKRPRVLLLDEPLSALDAKLREAMQIELVRLQQSVGITFVIVTHDQEEALSMADRVAVMEAGRVRQIASPRELYEAPASRFVADFIGKMNLLQARRDGDSAVLDELHELRLACPPEAPPQFHMALRPEKIRVVDAPTPGALCVRCTVDAMVYHGSESQVFALTDSDPAVTLNATVANTTRSQADLTRGDTVWLTWSADDMVLLTE